MKWEFLNDMTVHEKISGYIISLKTGTWDEPLDLESDGPNTLDIRQQMVLLRQGLCYAQIFNAGNEFLTAC